MTELAKKTILDAFATIKNLSTYFEMISAQVKLDDSFHNNAALALSELIKCIKHAALIQGDITGKELMPESFVEKAPEAVQENQEAAH